MAGTSSRIRRTHRILILWQQSACWCLWAKGRFLCKEIACMRAKSPQSSLTHVTLWTIAHQAPLSMGFSRQEYRSGLPCPPPGDLPNPGLNPGLLRLLHCRWVLCHLGNLMPWISKAKCFSSAFISRTESTFLDLSLVDGLCNYYDIAVVLF